MRMDLQFQHDVVPPSPDEFLQWQRQLWALVPDSVRHPTMAARLSPERPEVVWNEVWQHPTPWAEARSRHDRSRGTKVTTVVPQEIVDGLMRSGGPWGLAALARVPGVRVGHRTGNVSLTWFWDHALETCRPGTYWNPIIETLWAYRGVPEPLFGSTAAPIRREGSWGVGPLYGWLTRLPATDPAVLRHNAPDPEAAPSSTAQASSGEASFEVPSELQGGAPSEIPSELADGAPSEVRSKRSAAGSSEGAAEGSSEGSSSAEGTPPLAAADPSQESARSPRDLSLLVEWAGWLTEDLSSDQHDLILSALSQTTNGPLRSHLLSRMPRPWSEEVLARLTMDEHIVRLRYLSPEERTPEEGVRAWGLLRRVLDPTLTPPVASRNQIEAWGRGLLDVAVAYSPTTPAIASFRETLLRWAADDGTPFDADAAARTELKDRMGLSALSPQRWLADGFTLPTAAVTPNELDRFWNSGEAAQEVTLHARVAGHPALPWARVRTMLISLAARRQALRDQLEAIYAAAATQPSSFNSNTSTLQWQLRQLTDHLRDTTRRVVAQSLDPEDLDAVTAWASLASLDESLRLLTRVTPNSPAAVAAAEGIVTGHPVRDIASQLVKSHWAPMLPLFPSRLWRPLLLDGDREVRLMAARLLGQTQQVVEEGLIATPQAPLPPRQRVRRLPMVRANGSSLA